MYLIYILYFIPFCSSFLAAEEEVVVCTRAGHIVGVNWDGAFDPGLHWQLSDTPELNVIDIKYSSMIGGFALVFANGRVGFVPIHNNNVDDQSGDHRQRYGASKVQYVPEIDCGSTAAINHKYQLIAFGLKKYVLLLLPFDYVYISEPVTRRLTRPCNLFHASNSKHVQPFNTLQCGRRAVLYR